MQLYGGFIQSSGNDTYPKLVNTTFGESGYYVLNFNDVFMSMATLFTLLMVNNMNITAQGVQETSLGSYSRIYFVCWYAIGVVFVLNLFMTILLNTLGVFLFASYGRKSQVANTADPVDSPENTCGMTINPTDDKFSDAAVADNVSNGELLKDSFPPDTMEQSRPIRLSSGQFGRSHRASFQQQMSSSFFDDELYSWMIQGRASALLTQVDMLPPPGTLGESISNRSSAQVRDEASGDTSVSGSLLAVTLDHSTNYQPPPLPSSSESSTGSRSGLNCATSFEELLRASTMGRKSNITDISMQQIPAFLPDGSLALYGSDGSSIYDPTTFNVGNLSR